MFRIQRTHGVYLQLIAVVSEEVVHRLNANANGGQGPVFIEIAKREMRLAGLLDDLLDYPADKGIVAALEVRQIYGESDLGGGRQISQPRSYDWNSRKTYVLPHIRRCPVGNGSDRLATSAPNSWSNRLRIERQEALREDGIAKPVEFLKDALIQARIVVIGPAQHDEPNPAALFEFVQSALGLLAQPGIRNHSDTVNAMSTGAGILLPIEWSKSFQQENICYLNRSRSAISNIGLRYPTPASSNQSPYGRRLP